MEQFENEYFQLSGSHQEEIMKANSQTFMFGPLCARSNTTTMQSLFWPMQSLFEPMLSWPCKKSEPGNGNIFWLWKDKGWIVETISLDSINDHFLCMITMEILNFKFQKQAYTFVHHNSSHLSQYTFQFETNTAWTTLYKNNPYWKSICKGCSTHNL